MHMKAVKLIQGSTRDRITWKMKMVREKSGNMKNWANVMEFCDQTWNFNNFDPKLCQNCIFLSPPRNSAAI